MDRPVVQKPSVCLHFISTNYLLAFNNFNSFHLTNFLLFVSFHSFSIYFHNYLVFTIPETKPKLTYKLIKQIIMGNKI